MADVRPFAGLRFDPARVSLGAALCGPFDMIFPDDRRRLLDAGGPNAVRLEAPDPAALPDPYTNAAETLDAWVADGVLRQDESPAYYAVRHRFTHEGQPYTRTELLGALRLSPLAADGPVRPHEDTRSGPKEDRLKLMQATSANFSPVMTLHAGSPGLADLLDHALEAPTAQAEMDGGGSFELAALTAPADIDTVYEAIAGAPLYVADGHHRYETALHYAESLNGRAPNGETGDDAHNFLLTAVIAMDDPGLLNLPYHRLLRGLGPEQLERLRARIADCYGEEPRAMEADPATIAQAALADLEDDDAAFSVWGLQPGALTTLRLRDDALVGKVAAQAGLSRVCAGLAPALFRETLLTSLLGMDEEEAEREGLLSFETSAVRAVERVSRGEAQIAFLPKAVPMDAFREVSDLGDRLPPKSTCFFPKLATGLVFRRLKGELATPAR